MEISHLRYFEAIARHGSLTAAARALGVSQPTLTVAVRNLEEELGTTLLLRGREGVKLTRTGAELRAHAAQVFALLDRARERILGLEGDDVGRFVIGCHESLGAYFLPSFLKGFLGASPLLEISLWNGTSAAVRDAVLAREVDFGLVVNPRPHPELVMVELFPDAMDILIAAPPAPLSREEAEAHLRRGPLVYAGRVPQCQELIEHLAALSLLPTRMLSCGDLELVKSLALRGVGVALLPRRVAAYEQEGRLCRLHADLPSIPDIISLLYRADLHRTSAAMRLKDALVGHGKRLAGEALAVEAPRSR